MSGTERTRKPFADIYQLLLDRYGVQPEEAAFIDDSLKNVEGAEAVGIQGIHFQHAHQLREALRGYGVAV